MICFRINGVYKPFPKGIKRHLLPSSSLLKHIASARSDEFYLMYAKGSNLLSAPRTRNLYCFYNVDNINLIFDASALEISNPGSFKIDVLVDTVASGLLGIKPVEEEIKQDVETVLLLFIAKEEVLFWLLLFVNDPLLLIITLLLFVGIV